MSAVTIRSAHKSDCASINDIYNYYVVHSTCTYQTEPETLANRLTWFEKHGELHPVIVAETAGHIVGWGSLSAFHPRAGYSRTVENSVYVHHEHHGHGIGRAILQDLLQRGIALKHHTIIAMISGEQIASLALHQKLGFDNAGMLKEAGFKSGRWLDAVYLQKLLCG